MDPFTIHETEGRFYFTCSCGTRGNTRPTRAEVEALIGQHLSRAHGIRHAGWPPADGEDDE